MKKVFLVFVILVFGIGAYYVWDTRSIDERMRYEKRDMGTLSLTSSVFEHNGMIPAKYTCDGDDMNPPLSIAGVPDGTKSLVLIMDDPDATRGETWDHWIVWNIDPKTTKIDENSVPAGATQGPTSWGKNHQKYGGPCPPSGTHRYFFKLYALRALLDLPATSKKKDVENAMKDYVIEKAELVGLYRRK